MQAKIKTKIRYFNFNTSKEPNLDEIPTHVGFIILMVVGLAISWFTVRMGEKIISDIPAAQITGYNRNLEKAVQDTK